MGAVANFSFGGWANEVPNAGTTLEIDGAALRYILDPRPNPRPLFRVQARTFAGGREKWVDLPMVMSSSMLRFGTGIGPRFSIRFHQKTGTYDIYSPLALIKADLVLPKQRDSAPTIVLTPGCCTKPINVRAFTVSSELPPLPTRRSRS